MEAGEVKGSCRERPPRLEPRALLRSGLESGVRGPGSGVRAARVEPGRPLSAFGPLLSLQCRPECCSELPGPHAQEKAPLAGSQVRFLLSLCRPVSSFATR